MLRSIPRCDPAFTHAEAVTHYEASTRFADEALAELGSTATDSVPPTLLSAVLDWYRGTSTYDTCVDDLVDGFAT